MIKKIFLSFFFISNSAYSYVCNKPFDPHKTILFIGLNKAPLEIDSAAKAACDRGEGFKLLPTEAEIKQSTAGFDAYKKANSDFFDCQINKMPSQCTSLGAAVDKAQENYSLYHKKIELSPERLKKEMALLAQQNVAITSLVVSGHDGGGAFGGGDYPGSFNKEDLIGAIKDSYKNKKTLLNQLSSVYMWGCYTMGPSEVSAWQQQLPELKIAAGFYDKAPLAAVKASSSILGDLLAKEKSLKSSSDDMALKKLISSVPSINQNYIALYTKNQCSTKYYYNTKGSKYSDLELTKKGNHFINFNDRPNCAATQNEREKVRVDLMRYFNGTKEIPGNTAESDLRDMYALLRVQASCINANHVTNPDRVLMMIFQRDVNANFEDNNLKLISDASKDLSQLEKLTEETYKKNPKDPNTLALRKYLKDNKSKFFDNSFQFRSRMEIREMIHFIEGLKDRNLTSSARIPEAQTKNLNRLKKGMEIYLYNLAPNCMDSLEWHERIPGRKPAQKCQF